MYNNIASIHVVCTGKCMYINMFTDPLNVVEHVPYMDINLNRNLSTSLFALVWVAGKYTANLTANVHFANDFDWLLNASAVEMEPISDSLVRVDVTLRFSSEFVTTETLTVGMTWSFHLFGPEGHSITASTELTFATSTQPHPAQNNTPSTIILAVVVPLVVIVIVLSVVFSAYYVLHRWRVTIHSPTMKPQPVSDIRKLFQQVCMCVTLSFCVVVEL